MAIVETSYKWELTSTGLGEIFDARGFAQSLTFGVETSSGCTATIQLQHRMGSSIGPRSALSTVNLSTGGFATVQFLGPLDYLVPRVTDKTSGSTNIVTVWLKGN